MANRKISLFRKCKTEDGTWKRWPVAMGGNGKVKPDTVVEKGFERIYPVGHYELRSYAGAKTVWERVQGNATEALAALKVAQKRSTATVWAEDAGLKVLGASERVTLKDAADRFVTAASDRGSMEASEVYRRTLDDFLIGCKKVYADDLTNDDVLKFHVQMTKAGLAKRTISNRHQYLKSFLLSLGFDNKRLKEVAGRAPTYEKKMPEIFEPAQLTAFFGSLDEEYDVLLFDVLLQTGLREREAMHLEWKDLSFTRRILHVKSKPRYKHKIKDAEEREMPLSEELAERLEAYRAKHSNDQLVFGKLGGKVDVPDGHLLRRLKRLARLAGVNCGDCEACIASGECERWFLHKFRATYITALLRSGLDLRTVMKLSGHSDIESVMRYLRPAEGLEVQAKVNAIKWR